MNGRGDGRWAGKGDGTLRLQMQGHNWGPMGPSGQARMVYTRKNEPGQSAEAGPNRGPQARAGRLATPDAPPLPCPTLRQRRPPALPAGCKPKQARVWTFLRAAQPRLLSPSRLRLARRCEGRRLPPAGRLAAPAGWPLHRAVGWLCRCRRGGWAWQLERLRLLPPHLYHRRLRQQLLLPARHRHRRRRHPQAIQRGPAVPVNPSVPLPAPAPPPVWRWPAAGP